jgi:mRNA-degrading endonuclease RelE of RelBE toxin-antitoxin system
MLRKLPPEPARAVLAALDAYAATGAGDVKKLTDMRPPEHRLRVGDYRARFLLTADATVTVTWVGHRREAY